MDVMYSIIITEKVHECPWSERKIREGDAVVYFYFQLY